RRAHRGRAPRPRGEDRADERHRARLPALHSHRARGPALHAGPSRATAAAETPSPRARTRLSPQCPKPRFRTAAGSAAVGTAKVALAVHGARALLPGALDRRFEGLDRLGAGDGVAPVDHDEGHARSAEGPGLLALRFDPGAVASVAERRPHLLRIEPQLDTEGHQGIDVEDRAALAEIGAIKALPGGLLEAALRRQREQLVREPGVAHDVVTDDVG